MSLREFLRRAESSLDNTAVLDILQLRTHKSGSLTGLDMLKLNYLINSIINLQSNTVSEFTC